MTNETKFKYWCHFRATIKTLEPVAGTFDPIEKQEVSKQLEGSAGIERLVRLTTFEDVKDLTQMIANNVARENPGARVSVLLFGWTALDESPLLLPPGMH
jgi:hypothetical protein